VHCVMGTTGASFDELRGVGDANLFVAPNFAVGAVLMMQFARQAAAHMPESEIVELHHDGKLDAPSGTAKRTAELIRAAGGNLHEPIHSVRLPGLVAHQEVLFGGVGETLSIRHDSSSRESFMPGVLLAIRRVGCSIAQASGLRSGLDQKGLPAVEEFETAVRGDVQHPAEPVSGRLSRPWRGCRNRPELADGRPSDCAQPVRAAQAYPCSQDPKKAGTARSGYVRGRRRLSVTG
jgi:hypothetical protein